MNEKFVVVSISKDEAHVWNTGIDPKSESLEFHPHGEGAEHRITREKKEGGRFNERIDADYFEAIVGALSSAGRILLVGHGTGKSSAMLQLIQYLERKHPAIAHLIVDAVDADLERLTDAQVLALAREWRVLNKFNQ